MNDGRLIRVPIPELSEERRRDMVKMANRTTEEQRIAIRNIRRDSNDQIKAFQKNGDITEDDRDSGLEDIQKLTNNFIKKMDETAVAKEKEILEV